MVVRLYPLFVSTLNNKERLNNYLRGLCRLHPRPERRGFTLHMDKYNRLKIILHSEKGLKMDISHNEFVIMCIGIAIILWSTAPLMAAIRWW